MLVFVARTVSSACSAQGYCVETEHAWGSYKSFEQLQKLYA
jgi:hypothetical protein